MRTFEKVHTCKNNSRLFSQRQTTSNLVESLIMNKLDNPKLEYTLAEIQHDIKTDQEVDFNYKKAWRSRENAFELLRGKPSDSYNKLPRFLYNAYKFWVHDKVGKDDGCFLYVYVALYSSIKGCEYCMPNVVVDGSFLKSMHRGTLLTACAQDAAGELKQIFIEYNVLNTNYLHFFFVMLTDRVFRQYFFIYRINHV